MIKSFIGKIDGNVIRLEDDLHLSKGPRAIVTLRIIDDSAVEEITKRQLSFAIHLWDSLIIASMLENGIQTIIIENEK